MVLKRSLLILLSAFSTILTCEILTRLFIEIPPAPYNNKAKDPALGWRPKPEYHFHKDDFPDNKGGAYQVTVNFDKHGFRKWKESSAASVQKKLLFIGDSFTESLETSDKKVFYSVLQDSLPVSVSATGTAGYGTTQELLILNQYIDSIKPDWIILQMCTNDFSDNYWKLEEVTGYRVGERRPYITLTGNIEYYHPHYWLQDLKEYSLFLYFAATKMRNALLKMHFLNVAKAGDKLMAEKGMDYDLLKESYARTETALKAINTIAETHHAKLFVFIADNFPPALGYLTKLCHDNHIELIEGIGHEVATHENNGVVVRAHDGYHWNNKGQQIVGNKLIKYFRQKL